MILVSEDWTVIGASVSQTLTGALSALQRLPRGCGYGASGTPAFSSLGVLCESPVTSAHPQSQRGAGLTGKLSGRRHFPSSGALSEGRTCSCPSERHFPGGGMMVRPGLSTLSVTQPSGRGCHSATIRHPEPNSTV